MLYKLFAVGIDRTGIDHSASVRWIYAVWKVLCKHEAGEVANLSRPDHMVTLRSSRLWRTSFSHTRLSQTTNSFLTEQFETILPSWTECRLLADMHAGQTLRLLLFPLQVDRHQFQAPPCVRLGTSLLMKGKKEDMLGFAAVRVFCLHHCQ